MRARAFIEWVEGGFGVVVGVDVGGEIVSTETIYGAEKKREEFSNKVWEAAETADRLNRGNDDYTPKTFVEIAIHTVLPREYERIGKYYL